MSSRVPRLVILGAVTIAASSLIIHLLRVPQPIAEPLFLHIYSNRYDIHSMSSELPGPPREHQCIATLSIIPGIYFYAFIPNHYEPEMEVEGTVTKYNGVLTADFTILISDAGTAIEHRQTAPVALNSFNQFGKNDGYDNEFHFVISAGKAPPQILPVHD